MHTDFEKHIIDLLLEGKTQYEISADLKRKGIKPNSLSSIEKALKIIKEDHKANTMFHLGAILTLKRYIQ